MSSWATYRWFVGLAIDDPVWDHSPFSKNRDRPIEQEAAKALFTEVLAQAKAKKLLSDEHFCVDGTIDQGVGIAQELRVQGWPAAAFTLTMTAVNLRRLPKLLAMHASG